MPLGKPSGGSAEPPRRLPLSKDTEDDETRSSTLWAGNLSSDISDSDLMAVFGKHGALDCTMMRGSRSYAFLYFRGADEAKAAKNALQGAAIRGSAVRIEFARPAKAAKQIWIGGFNSSISKDQLREEFSKYGKFEDYKFFRDRNSAIIEYYKLEDAISAHKNMNGKHLAGEQLRIDFVRFQPPRRDWPDRIDLRSGHIMNRTMGLFPPDNMRNFHDQSYLASKRIMPPGGRSDPQPSNVLWIGYPPSVQVDEQMLHNAMILFGEIERIKCFPSRHHAFVEFRSVDEARRAKEGLQGRLFNDPRIQILFSGTEATSKDNPSLLPAMTELRPGLFVNEGSFGALELLAHGRSVAPSAFPGSVHSTGIPGTNVSTRPFGTQSYDPYHAGTELHDIDAAPRNFPDSDSGKSATTSWRNRSPSAPGILPSPGMRPHVRPFPDGRDGFDTRETKRTRIDGSSDDGFYPTRRLDSAGNLVSGFSQPVSSRTRFSPMVHERSPDIDYRWRGVIAKGGSHVCHARCIPMGKGIECPLPDIVNCSARTGLDMLTKHYAEAVGFDIAFFLPDSEEDFASYTEFLRYLGSKDRAGVAKLDDGTTLFLVPPSDFLSKVLKINGPERLYGVVLKFPQQSLTAVSQRPQSLLPHGSSQYIDQQDPSNLQKGYTYVPQNEEQSMKIGYNQPLDEEVIHPSVTGKSLGHAEMQHVTQLSAREHVSNPPAISKAEASLPPEFFASLASLIPNSQTVQMPSTSVIGPSASGSMLNDLSMTYLKVQEHQTSHSASSLELPTYLPHQLGQQFSTQAPPSQFPTYSNGPSMPDQTAQMNTGSSQAHIPSMNIPQTPSVLSRPLNNYGISQNGQLSGMQNNSHYPYGSSSATQNNYGSLLAANASDVIAPGVQLPPGPTFSYHDQISNIPPVQMPSSLPSSRSSADVVTGQHGQSILPGPGQGTSQGDADKNQRYQSTLQFAASLLLRIQQEQQAKSQVEQGSGKP